jgi:SnoaL-like domain
MNRDVAAIFSDIDSFDPSKFVAHLTDDVVFRFGNGDPVIGREAVAAAVGGFFTTIAGLKHQIKNIWQVEDVAIAQIDVEYTRLDGKVVVTPNADILEFEGALVKSWQIYIDLAPVYA